MYNFRFYGKPPEKSHNFYVSSSALPYHDVTNPLENFNVIADVINPADDNPFGEFTTTPAAASKNQDAQQLPDQRSKVAELKSNTPLPLDGNPKVGVEQLQPQITVTTAGLITDDFDEEPSTSQL